MAEVEHYSCEDGWYSCPKSEEGCDNDLAGDDCTCGADRINQRIARLEEALRFYANPANLESFVVIASNDFKGTSWGELDEEISRVAAAALKEEE